MTSSKTRLHARATLGERDSGLLFPVPGPRLLASVFLVALCFLLGQVPTTGAATIATGPIPIDTVIRPDGSAAYILNQGDSSISVVDTATNQVVAIHMLGVPPGTCSDLDWHATTSLLHVGLNSGGLLSVDPTLPGACRGSPTPPPSRSGIRGTTSTG